MRHRVVVTGMGVVTPIGCTVADYASSLFAGVSGAGPITLFDPAQLRTRIAAEVKQPFPGFRDRKIAFAVDAARQAMEEARSPGTVPGMEDAGAAGGLSLGIGLELFSMDDLAASRQPNFVPPDDPRERLTFLQTPSDICVHLLCHQHGLRHPPLTHISACASGTDAIGTAFRLVRSGRRRWMLAGGTDSMINPMGLGGFCKIGATTTANDRPEQASRPFDRRRDGFLLSEGAATLVLERADDARSRGAVVHGEIVGYGTSLDAHGISEPHPEGRGALQAMNRALADAELSPDAIDAVNAHGSSTPKNDSVETLALKQLLGSRAYRVPVVSTKSMIGHAIAAAGALEAVAALVCVEQQRLHPTINQDDPDPACDLDYVPRQARAHAQEYVLSNSFGFGGQNSSLVLRRARSFDD